MLQQFYDSFLPTLDALGLSDGDTIDLVISKDSVLSSAAL